MAIPKNLLVANELIEFLLTARDTSIPLPVLKQHFNRLIEQRVSAASLTALDRSGLYTDLLEAAARGQLDQVDRVAFRRLLGLAPKTGEATDKKASEIVVPSFDPETGIYRWEVDYGESIFTKKARAEGVPIAVCTKFAAPGYFPDDRQGKMIVTGHIEEFGGVGSQNILEMWVGIRGKTLARPKEFIDFLRNFPPPRLCDQTPLVAAGQFYKAASDGEYYFLKLDVTYGKYYLDSVTLARQTDNWGKEFHFLVLDPPAPETPSA